MKSPIRRRKNHGNPPPTTTRLLKRSIGVLRTGLGPFISLALIVQIPALAWRLVEVVQGVDSEVVLVEHPIAGGVTVLLSLLLEALVGATMVYGVLQILRGAPLQIGDSLRFAAVVDVSGRNRLAPTGVADVR